MPIIGTTRDAIAADLLTRWTANMVAAGYPAFDAANTAECVAIARGLALDLEAHQSNAEALGDEIIPVTASSEMLARHAAVDGVTAREATHGTWTVRVAGATGGASGTPYSTTGRKLVSKTGLTYTPPTTFVMPPAATFVDIDVTADTAGSVADLNAGTVLTWTSAPAGIDPTATVQGIGSAGTAALDAGGDAEILAGVLAWRRGRPASGSPPDWVLRAQQSSAVYRAYCYPCLKPDVGAYVNGDLDTPGCVTVVVLGPPQGDSPTFKAVIGGITGAGTEPAAVRGYFLGTHTADGTPTYGGDPQYPGTMDPADMAIEAPRFAPLNITVQLTLDGANAYPFPIGAPMTVAAGGSERTLVVTGNQTGKNGMRVLVFVGIDHIRGGWQLVRLPVGVFAAGNTTFDLVQTPLNAPPTIGDDVLAAPGNWEAFRLAFFALFDDFGPGDVPTAIAVAPAAGYTRRRRYPPESFYGVSAMRLAKLIEVAVSVPGVVDCAIVTPVLDQVPAPKNILSLGELRPA